MVSLLGMCYRRYTGQDSLNCTEKYSYSYTTEKSILLYMNYASGERRELTLHLEFILEHDVRNKSVCVFVQ